MAEKGLCNIEGCENSRRSKGQRPDGTTRYKNQCEIHYADGLKRKRHIKRKRTVKKNKNNMSFEYKLEARLVGEFADKKIWVVKDIVLDMDVGMYFAKNDKEAKIEAGVIIDTYYLIISGN